MRVHYLQHVPFAGPGCIADWARARRGTLSHTFFFAGEDLPPVDLFDLLVVLGGPINVYDHERTPYLFREKRFVARCLAASIPVLAISMGSQLLADVLGAPVRVNDESEMGWFPLELTPEAAGTAYFADAAPELEVLHWHKETFDIPRSATPIGSSAACANQGFIYAENVIGLQFHLETTATSVEGLITDGAHEFSEGRYVQSSREVMSHPARFERANAQMRRVLDALEGKVSTRPGPNVLEMA